MKRIILIFIAIVGISGCCKDKAGNLCNADAFEVQPFVQTTTKYRCNGNDEYTYILRSKEQVDSLEPNCFSIGPLAFPIDETNMAYIIIGRLSYHNKDTFLMSSLLKDTCAKRVTYEINMMQRDTTVNCCPYGIGAIMNVFCSVENIPVDYEVEIKYKYVPLP